MFVVYLLWIVFVFGGLFMGVEAVQAMRHQGFAVSLLLNAVVYLGFALYGVPKLFKLVMRRR
jgi:hypothetical protein